MKLRILTYLLYRSQILAALSHCVYGQHKAHTFFFAEFCWSKPLDCTSVAPQNSTEHYNIKTMDCKTPKGVYWYTPSSFKCSHSSRNPQPCNCKRWQDSLGSNSCHSTRPLVSLPTYPAFCRGREPTHHRQHITGNQTCQIRA